MNKLSDFNVFDYNYLNVANETENIDLNQFG